VRIFGVDPGTAFTVRHLKQNGVEVLGVVTTVERWVGLTVENVRIQALREVAQSAEPLLLSAYPGLEAGAVEALHSVGFAGTVYRFGDSALEEVGRPVRIDDREIDPMPTASSASFSNTVPSRWATARFARRLVGKLLSGWDKRMG